MIALPPAGNRRHTALADWVELELLFGGSATLSHVELLDVLTDDPGGDTTDEDLAHLEAIYGEQIDDEFIAQRRNDARAQAEEGISEPEQIVEATWLELAFREQVVGDAYPVQVNEGLATGRGDWQQTTSYAFLAMLAARVAYGLSLPVQEPARRFEELVTVALEAYTGGEAVRFGWPHNRDEFPTDFKKAARDLAHRLGEKPGGMEAIGTNAKDYALDVVAWRGFSDQRRGQHILLCQCATGKDWNEKVISERGWEKVIDFTVAPTRSVAFPFVPSREEADVIQWLDVAFKGGVPFDRLRIASLAADVAVGQSLIDDMGKWVTVAQQSLPQDQ